MTKDRRVPQARNSARVIRDGKGLLSCATKRAQDAEQIAALVHGNGSLNEQVLFGSKPASTRDPAKRGAAVVTQLLGSPGFHVIGRRNPEVGTLGVR